MELLDHKNTVWTYLLRLIVDQNHEERETTYQKVHDALSDRLDRANLNPASGGYGISAIVDCINLRGYIDIHVQSTVKNLESLSETVTVGAVNRVMVVSMHTYGSTSFKFYGNSWTDESRSFEAADFLNGCNESILATIAIYASTAKLAETKRQRQIGNT